MIRIAINSKGDPAGVLGAARKRMRDGFRAMVEALAESAKKTSPVRTGKLRDSVGHSSGTAFSGSVVYGAPYASFLHEGTGLYGPHGKIIVIRPKKGKALFWPGAAHPVSVVRQKGIRPRDFVWRAIREARLAESFDGAFND